MFNRKKYFFKNKGYCNCCEKKTTFTSENDWFRDFYICSSCGSLPRERALMYCIEKFFPQWKDCVVHESSPSDRGASPKLKKYSKEYIPSQYFPDVKSGEVHQGFQCEDIENMSFDDSSIDLHVTQDVLEHIFSPDKAFKEIARTLRPGGMHIFTVPIVNKNEATDVCAIMSSDNEIEYLCDPEYHRNPISLDGSLVTRKWGFDICDYIFDTSGLFTKVIDIDSLDLGIRAEYIEVLITSKTLK